MQTIFVDFLEKALVNNGRWGHKNNPELSTEIVPECFEAIPYAFTFSGIQFGYRFPDGKCLLEICWCEIVFEIGFQLLPSTNTIRPERFLFGIFAIGKCFQK